MNYRSKEIPNMVCVTISGNCEGLAGEISMLIREVNRKRAQHGKPKFPYCINQIPDNRIDIPSVTK